MLKKIIAILLLISSTMNASENIYSLNHVIVLKGVIYEKKTRSPIDGVIIVSTIDNEKVEMHVKNGEKYAIKEYHNNGELYKHIPFKDGKEHGLVMEYYKDGSLSAQTEYHKGDKHKRQEYNDDKVIWSEIHYKDGKKNGLMKEYKNGKLWSEEHYVDGKLHGTMKFFYKTGKLRAKIEMRNNNFISGVMFYEDNKPEKKLTRKSFESIFLEY